MSNKEKSNGRKDFEACFRIILRSFAGQELLRKLLGGCFSQAVVDTVEDVSWRKQKANLEIRFATDHPVLRINIKTFEVEKTPNHLERRNHSDFCHRNQVRVRDKRFLQNIWLRKAKGGRKQPLVDGPIEHERTIKILSSIEPGVSALCGYDHPQVLAFYNGRQGCWHIYDMARQVLPLVRAKQVSLSPDGNIDIGEYIMIQRKGPDRGNSLDDIEHRSNNVQVKMRVERFYNEVKPLVACECRC